MSEPYEHKCTKCGSTNVVAYDQSSIQHCFVCKAIYSAPKNPNYVPGQNKSRNIMDSLPLHKKRVEKKAQN